jgi:hypothetical protein
MGTLNQFAANWLHRKYTGSQLLAQMGGVCTVFFSLVTFIEEKPLLDATIYPESGNLGNHTLKLL